MLFSSWPGFGPISASAGDGLYKSSRAIRQRGLLQTIACDSLAGSLQINHFDAHGPVNSGVRSSSFFHISSRNADDLIAVLASSWHVR
jgi:hypothetical protein